jgi:hypothetical protein
MQSKRWLQAQMGILTIQENAFDAAAQPQSFSPHNLNATFGHPEAAVVFAPDRNVQYEAAHN